MVSRKRTHSSFQEKEPEITLSYEQQEIAQWLQKVKFRKQLIGGVNEEDVWKKINELNDLYNRAIVAERARYNALLERKKSAPKEKRNISGTTPRRRELPNE